MKQRSFDKKAFDEYQENEKRKTICLFKVFILFLLITNVVFVFFVISYKIQISQTKTNNINKSNEIALYQDKNNQKESQSYKMLINLFAVINTRYNSLTEILRSKEEYNKVMAYANMEDKFSSYICYQGSIDGDSYKGYHSYCGLFPDQIILIELTDGTRIGAYISNAQSIGSEEDDKVVDDPNAVLFNIDTDVSYKIKDPHNAFTIYKEGLFKIGDNDLFIADNYFTNDNSFSEFPSQFGSSDIPKYSLTNGQRNFKIRQLEVFTLWNEIDLED
jgi:hypothetical protein